MFVSHDLFLCLSPDILHLSNRHCHDHVPSDSPTDPPMDRQALGSPYRSSVEVVAVVEQTPCLSDCNCHFQVLAVAVAVAVAAIALCSQVGVVAAMAFHSDLEESGREHWD